MSREVTLWGCEILLRVHKNLSCIIHLKFRVQIMILSWMLPPECEHGPGRFLNRPSK
jgi:hypothetical protein